MRTASVSTDELLLARLQAPPDLNDGMQALAYWRQRSQRLPWYRVRARREAVRMTVRWEHRVRGALISQRGVPVVTRMSAGLLVAQTRLRRWGRHTAIILVTTVAVALLAAPFVVTTAFLIRLF